MHARYIFLKTLAGRAAAVGLAAAAPRATLVLGTLPTGSAYPADPSAEVARIRAHATPHLPTRRPGGSGGGVGASVVAPAPPKKRSRADAAADKVRGEIPTTSDKVKR